ncbi:MAG: OFA family MFS transporter [Candidatus Methanomethylophilaceae archaeon]
MRVEYSHKDPPGGRWTIVITGILLHLCLGSIYAYGVLRNSLLDYFKELGLEPSAMDMTWPFIVFLAFFALTMPLAGPYIQRYGPRTVSMVGGVLCGLGWLAASFASSPFMLIPLYGVIGGIGVGIAYGAPISASACWFPDKRGLAVGLTVLGFGFSSAIITYSSSFLMDNGWGIMSVMRLFGLAFIVLSVTLSLLLRFPGEDWKRPVASSAKKGPVVHSVKREDMVKTRAFKGLWLCYTIGSLAGLTAIGISGPVGIEVFANAGMDPDAANALIFTLILPFAFFNGLGRPLFGDLTDRLSARGTAMLTFFIIILACMTMYLGYDSVLAYIICFALLWGCLGGWLAIAPTATANFFGMRDNARNYGLVFTAYGAGAIIGGVVSAQAKDLLGDFRPFFLILTALSILGLAVAWMTLRAPEDTSS